MSSDASAGTSEEDQVGSPSGEAQGGAGPLTSSSFCQQAAALAPEALTSDLTDSFSGPASVHSSASDDDDDDEDDDVRKIWFADAEA